MPLLHSCTSEGISHNIAEMSKHHPHNVAVAASLNEARRSCPSYARKHPYRPPVTKQNPGLQPYAYKVGRELMRLGHLPGVAADQLLDTYWSVIEASYVGYEQGETNLYAPSEVAIDLLSGNR